MNSCLEAYRALKNSPVAGSDNEVGTLTGLALSQPDWRVASITVSFGKRTFLGPKEITRFEGHPPRLYARLTGAQARVARASQIGSRHELCDADGLLGRAIVAQSTEVGELVDLLVNTSRWLLKYFVVRTGARAVLVDASWSRGAAAASSALRIALPAHLVRSAPEYWGVSTLTRGYERAVHAHYTASRDGVRPPVLDSASAVQALG